MRVLVIGASGMAGHMITLFLRNKGYEVLTISGKHSLDEQTTLVDVCEFDKLGEYLKTHKVNAVINCAGILVKGSELNKCQAILVNAHLPHYLEKFYRNTDTKVIHLSTDCVFSGKMGPYTEASFYDGELFYDRSKALGEIKNTKDLTFRMSIIGPDREISGVGLLNWFLMQQGSVYGYTNVFWNGVTTLELAKAIECALHEPVCGLYHLVSTQIISKYELLCMLQKKFRNFDVQIIPKEVEGKNKALINTRTDFNFTVCDYEQMIEELEGWVQEHSNLYTHYLRKGRD